MAALRQQEKKIHLNSATTKQNKQYSLLSHMFSIEKVKKRKSIA
jgi:hypothetical protein